jgi:hypothetical protein
MSIEKRVKYHTYLLVSKYLKNEAPLDLKKSSNQKQELPVVAIFGNGS